MDKLKLSLWEWLSVEGNTLCDPAAIYLFFGFSVCWTGFTPPCSLLFTVGEWLGGGLCWGCEDVGVG